MAHQFHQKGRRGKRKIKNFSSTPSFLFLPLTLFLVFGLVGCGGKSPPASQQNTAASSGNKDSNLTFFDVTLEQADEVGRPIWKVRAKTAKYKTNWSG
jgi:hypothetical protein